MACLLGFDPQVIHRYFSLSYTENLRFEQEGETEPSFMSPAVPVIFKHLGLRYEYSGLCKITERLQRVVRSHGYEVGGHMFMSAGQFVSHAKLSWG